MYIIYIYLHVLSGPIYKLYEYMVGIHQHCARCSFKQAFEAFDASIVELQWNGGALPQIGNSCATMTNIFSSDVKLCSM